MSNSRLLGLLWPRFGVSTSDHSAPSKCSVRVTPETPPTDVYPAAHTSLGPRATTAFNDDGPWRFGFGVETTDHCRPSQCSAIVPAPIPTAQMSFEAMALAEYRTVVGNPGWLGVATTDQEWPSQCSAIGKWLRWFEPTAHTS